MLVVGWILKRATRRTGGVFDAAPVLQSRRCIPLYRELKIQQPDTDDYLRNHGFLYSRSQGWRLCPAYDLSPVPVDLRPGLLSTATDLENNSASLALAPVPFTWRVQSNLS